MGVVLDLGSSMVRGRPGRAYCLVMVSAGTLSSVSSLDIFSFDVSSLLWG